MRCALSLKSSTRMISCTRCAGDLLSTDQMVRMRGDHASLVKMMMMLVVGRSCS